MTGIDLVEIDDDDDDDNPLLTGGIETDEGEEHRTHTAQGTVHADGNVRQRQQQQQPISEPKQREERDSERRRPRASLRTKLCTVYPRRLLHFVDQHRLLPESWLVIEGDKGEQWPRFVCNVRDNYRRWGKSAAAAVSFVASVVWLVTWLIGTPSAVMHDGSTVVNMWAPAYSHVYVLSDGAFADWITEHRSAAALPSVMDMHKGYFTAEIYGASERRNVTFEWIEQALQHACKSDASGEKCHCVPAIQLGVLANVVWLGGEDASVAINPVITDRSVERSSIEYDDGTTAYQPIAVIAEFTTRTQQRTRKKFKLYDAFCLTRSLDLLVTPPVRAHG